MGGSLIYEEISNLTDDIDIFVETGTYKGDTTVMASKYFKQVFTFELNEKLYSESKERFKREKCFNVNAYLGDSVELLQLCMPFLKNENCMYFIDAHISGYDSSYKEAYMVPLFQELEIILSNVQSDKNIFIIDDARFWIGENKPFDWAHISLEKILDMFKRYDKNIIKHYLFEDRYYIII